MNHLIDMTGQKFNRLTVVQRVGVTASRCSLWLCICDCGEKTIVRRSSLVSGSTKSCGCLKSQKFQMLGYARKKPNTEHRLYTIWRGMRQRCYNSKQKRYKDYGGRGITVCDEWRDDYQAFYAWAMANGYRDDLSIDRIDNDGNYEPSNCRWATGKEQAHNKRCCK